MRGLGLDRRALAALTTAVLVACGGAQSAPAPEVQQTPPVSEATPTSNATSLTDMHGHFEDINAIQNTLISGNLVAARQLAKQIRIGFAGPAPEGWGPYIERSVASAEMLEVTDDLGMASRLAASMANTCGGCHRAHDLVVIEHLAVPPPRMEDKLEDFMMQHRWAADRMWEGLIGPSDAAWSAGAQALQSSKLTTEDIEGRLLVTPSVEKTLVQIQEDAAAAAMTVGPEARLTLYGRFLAGCASCHRDMKNQRD